MNRLTECLLTAITLAASSFSMALNFDEANHLLGRSGFAPSFEEISTFLPLSKKAAVQKLITDANTPDHLPPRKEIIQVPTLPGPNASDAEKKNFQKLQKQNALALQQWWLQRMIDSQTPLAEQMTLFWHGHFTSSIQKVKFPTLMYNQNALYRENGLGNYKDLVQAMAKDSAMIIYLDSQSSQKRNPNENFARELLELFTLGEGHYSEEDIKQAARAFTGWRVDKKTGNAQFIQARHDNTQKTFFGVTGNLDGEDIINIIFEEKGEQAARYLVEKLWRHFISYQPDTAEVSRLSQLFIEHNYEIAPLLKEMFLSPFFWAEDNRGSMVKSPVDLIVGTQRVFGLSVTERSLLRQMGKELEQALFAPPNVKGWPGGVEWISSSTLLARVELLSKVTRTFARPNMAKNSNGSAITDYTIDQWQELLLPLPPAEFQAPMASSQNKRLQTQRTIAALLQDPTYQLK